MRCRPVFAVTFLSSFLLLAATPLFAAWNFLPAGYPYINDLVADSSGQRVFEFLDGAGPWLSTDGGQSWNTLGPRIFGDQSALYGGFCQLDPRADSVVVVTYHSLHETTDGGLTWQTASSPLISGDRSFAVWRHAPNVWFYVNNDNSNTRFHRSSDYGRTWPDSIVVMPSGYSSGQIIQDLVRDSTIYIFDPYSSSAWKSDDLGSTWSQVLDGYSLTPGQYQDVYEFVPLSNGIYIALTGNTDQAYESTDRGSSWQEITPWAQYGLFASLIEDRLHPGRLYATVHLPFSLLRSNDYGLSWYPIGTGLPQRFYGSGSLRQDEFSDRLFLWHDYGYFVSTDEGNSWSEPGTPPLGMPDPTFTITPEAVFSPNIAYVAPQFILESPFASWQALNIPETVNGIAFSVSSFDFKHGDTLAGVARMRVPPGREGQPQSRRLYSYDHGASWNLGSALPHLFRSDFMFAADHPDSPDRIFRETEPSNEPYRDTLLVSDDHGVSWRVFFVSPDGYFIGSAAQAGDTSYVEADEESPLMTRYWRTTDDGVTWSELPRLDGYFASNLVTLGGNAYVFRGEYVWVWRDGRWDQLSHIPAVEADWQYWWRLMAVPGEHPLIVAAFRASDSIFVSADSGLTFEPRAVVLPYGARGFRSDNFTYDPFRHRLWASTEVGSVYLDISELSATNEPFIPHPSSLILSAFPNPFNSESRIIFDLEKRGRVTLDLFNIEGRHVRTITNQIYESGRHEIHLDASTLSSGIYFVRLVSPLHTKTTKIVLLK